ncbi:hypothetical protein KCU61_g394, partial [Aureobasidium melanogenum]
MQILASTVRVYFATRISHYQEGSLSDLDICSDPRLVLKPVSRLPKPVASSAFARIVLRYAFRSSRLMIRTDYEQGHRIEGQFEYTTCDSYRMRGTAYCTCVAIRARLYCPIFASWPASL